MDVLTSAADAVFSHDMEEGPGESSVHRTPSKRSREVLSEVTHTINISPEKLHSSSLQSLFMASAIKYSSTKTQGSAGNPLTSSGNSKTISHLSPMMTAVSPSREKVMGRSPITPTSNLKLLTRIASMEESFSSKKMLFHNKCIGNKLDENSLVLKPHITQTKSRQKPKLQRYNSDSVSTGRASGKASSASRAVLKKHCSIDDHSQGVAGLGHLAPLDEVITRPTESSRKDKSLGLLSEKFLEHFPMEVSFLETPRRMVIDEVATILGTERRRVYDIINVLESLNMAARVQKNMYQWMGKLYLEETLGRLKAIAVKLNLRTQMQALHTSSAEGEFKTPQWKKTSWNSDGEKVDSRREKSLGILCQKFLMLLLVSPERYLLSLDDALKMLMGDMCEDTDRLRTRGRRLYDIANVLTSLGLVQRIPLAKGFRYIGPEVEPIPSDEDTGMRLRHSLLPSCLWAGESTGKENTTCPADHDVTPSAAPPPAPKRGRPRKLSTDFSASLIPAAKRTRLQRTRSEDIMAGKQTRRFTRHPSLHEICQVAEVEREKLLLKEQQQQRQQKEQQKSSPIGKPIPLILKKENNASVQKQGFLPTSSAVAPNLTATLHQKYFPQRTKKIPVALTFKKYNEDNTREGHTIVPINITQIPRTSEVKIEKSSPQMQTFNHSLQSEQKPSEAFHSLGVSRGFTYLTTPSQPVNKILLKSWNQETSAVPVVVPREPQQNNSPSVIRVVTNMGGATKHHREPPKVYTFHSASQTHNPNPAAIKQYVLQAGGSLQQVSPRRDSNGQAVLGHSQIGEGIGAFRDQSYSKPSSYTVYTISGSQLLSSTLGERPQSHGDCGSTSKPFVTSNWADNTTSNGMNVHQEGHQATNAFTHLTPRTLHTSRDLPGVECQASSDASSTDSELEEIFGDCFRFTRPKSLATGSNTSQDGATGNAVGLL
ncbi:uncharacterized protein LOC127007719 isoform X2 [Eriocheir sinensis]|uniref:uncharacterized protein LOC127007719 isoform X2 n=1 Tax=Eriocheir sinensis TaxID=95602 RepID=UPI0021C5EE1B|nr:uncharacterized protein LOC127007719 isoform X2 [Eriocheir sinensis]